MNNNQCVSSVNNIAVSLFKLGYKNNGRKNDRIRRKDSEKCS